MRDRNGAGTKSPGREARNRSAGTRVCGQEPGALSQEHLESYNPSRRVIAYDIVSVYSRPMEHDGPAGVSTMQVPYVLMFNSLFHKVHGLLLGYKRFNHICFLQIRVSLADGSYLRDKKTRRVRIDAVN